MHNEIIKIVENRDIKRLKYIFVDCLDVDPTFKAYEEDYNYCLKQTDLGLFELNRELTPLKNKIEWNFDYWNQLKNDLLKNFSKERFSHMQEVAQVIYADKIKRLEIERQEELRKSERKKQQKIVNNFTNDTTNSFDEVKAIKEKTAKRFKATQEELSKNNEKMRYEEEKQKQELEALKRQFQHDNQVLHDRPSKSLSTQNESQGNDNSKKILGVVLIVSLAIVIIAIISH